MKLKFSVFKRHIWVARPAIDYAVDNLGKIVWSDNDRRFIFVAAEPEYTNGPPKLHVDELMQIAGKIFLLTEKKMRRN